MKITCISDLHGHYPSLPGGDLLIIAGDLTAKDDSVGYLQFCIWLAQTPYRKRILIAGNHDNHIDWLLTKERKAISIDFEYLEDSGTEFEGLKIWGSPWTKTFAGMNPRCKAFTVDSDEELAEKWAFIPEEVDILITHSPPYWVMDETFDTKKRTLEHVGSPSLRKKIETICPRIHIFGHIHEEYGVIYLKSKKDIMCVNASHVTEHYEPTKEPITIQL